MSELAGLFVVLTVLLMVLRWRPLRRFTCNHPGWTFDGTFPGESGPIFNQHCPRCKAPRSIYG